MATSKWILLAAAALQAVVRSLAPASPLLRRTSRHNTPVLYPIPSIAGIMRKWAVFS
jgi:hypothetical protein